MAYNVYICCDRCGIDPFAWTNITVSLSKAEKIAKRNGWKVTKNGTWYCPECREILKKEGKNNGMDSD